MIMKKDYDYENEIKKHKEQLRRKSENIRPLLLDRLSEKDMIKIMFDDFLWNISDARVVDIGKEYLESWEYEE